MTPTPTPKNQDSYRPISVRITDPIPQDDLDKLADPILDRIPQTRGKRKVRGVLAILDQLNREGCRR